MKLEHVKWVLVGLVVAIFVPWFAVVISREMSSQQAIELHTAFSQPRVQVRFRKDIRWDPQSFLGRGRQAGLWDWSPKGVFLTPKGQNYFVETDQEIRGDLVLGKRRITTIKSVQPRDGEREVLFIYTWSELTDAVKMLNDPPKPGKEFQALARLAPKGGAWEVKTLSDPEYSHVIDIFVAEMKR